MNRSLDDLLASPVGFISNENQPLQEPFISTRIRLSRNLEGLPFPTAATPESAQEVCRLVEQAVEKSQALGSDYYCFDLAQLSALDRQVLLERRLVSPDFLEHPAPTRLIASLDERTSIMVNEEDELRIQLFHPGSQLEETWREISAIDDKLSQVLDYAFDPKLGYLTACPTNVGTGIRASVMLHLPGLMISDQIQGIVRGLNKLGLAVRGFFGEGSDNQGNIYQISNQSTLGESEEQIIRNLQRVLVKVCEEECKARESLLQSDRFAVLDHVGRSYGTLRYSYKLDENEVYNCLSSLRLGVDLGLFRSVTVAKLNEICFAVSAGHLQRRFGGELSSAECAIKRAEICRNMLR